MTNKLSDISPEVLASCILIVDDSEVNRMFLEKTLQKRGFKNLIHAEDGSHALEMVKLKKPDLVLLDLMMPTMDGFGFCEAVRKLPEGKDLPILVQTALTKEGDRVKAFNKGATDFVSKPLFPDELYARVIVHLENRHNLRSLKIYKARVEAELNAARDLQHSILPQIQYIKHIEEECGLDIASYFEPSSEIGGDFWGIKKLSPEQVAFWMADFSGHSVSAALNVFRLQAYIQEDLLLATRPGEYLSMLNEKLLKLLARGQFATMFYGIIDQEKDRLYYASAGNPHPILLCSGGNQSTVIDGSGRPLGISTHNYATKSVGFLPGDVIFFYSDTLVETANAQGKHLDERSILSWMREIEEKPKAVMKEILTRFHRHANEKIHDDLTLCIIQRTGTQPKRIRAHG